MLMHNAVDWVYLYGAHVSMSMSCLSVSTVLGSALCRVGLARLVAGVSVNGLREDGHCEDPPSEHGLTAYRTHLLTFLQELFGALDTVPMPARRTRES